MRLSFGLFWQDCLLVSHVHGISSISDCFVFIVAVGYSSWTPPVYSCLTVMSWMLRRRKGWARCYRSPALDTWDCPAPYGQLLQTVLLTGLLSTWNWEHANSRYHGKVACMHCTAKSIICCLYYKSIGDFLLGTRKRRQARLSLPQRTCSQREDWIMDG